ncbi:MAG: hypothetical protein FD123_2976 [Bacteroidetes bacterium]|nr:MAG: hypothetical protein FD123_2976 [Bacteroidota bacterium]
MPNKIYSKVIGELEQNPEFADWWMGKIITVPLFDNKKLPVTFVDLEPGVDQQFLDEADTALRNFLDKTSACRMEISSLVYRNCMNVLDDAGDDEADKALRDIKNDNEIWNFVYPEEIYVQRRSSMDKDIYIQIACNCAWEQEHGLQLVFRQGKKLTRVSDQDGHLTEADAFDKPDEEDELLSKF